jgi:hypothetical protein
VIELPGLRLNLESTPIKVTPIGRLETSAESEELSRMLSFGRWPASRRISMTTDPLVRLVSIVHVTFSIGCDEIEEWRVADFASTSTLKSAPFKLRLDGTFDYGFITNPRYPHHRQTNPPSAKIGI